MNFPSIDTESRISIRPTMMQLASSGQRFCNFLIDSFLIVVLLGLCSFLVREWYNFNGRGEVSNDVIFDRVFSLPAIFVVQFTYYFASEFSLGVTVGKLLTGTKVVDVSGKRASLLQIIGRTLGRYIPFESFSFFGSNAIGWHDSIAKTRAVKA